MNHINRYETMKDLTVTNSLTLADDAKHYYKLYPQIEIGKIAQNSKPTIVARGVTKGYSFPIYNSDDEEIFMCACTPRDWDEESDPILVLPIYLDTANAAKNFKIQVSWNFYDPDGDVVSASSNDVEVQVATGTAAQYKSFKVSFTIDYDIDGVGNEIGLYNRLCFRVRRIAASANEIAGEAVLGPCVIKFMKDKV